MSKSNKVKNNIQESEVPLLTRRQSSRYGGNQNQVNPYGDYSMPFQGGQQFLYPPLGLGQQQETTTIQRMKSIKGNQNRRKPPTNYIDDEDLKKMDHVSRGRRTTTNNKFQDAPRLTRQQSNTFKNTKIQASELLDTRPRKQQKKMELSDIVSKASRTPAEISGPPELRDFELGAYQTSLMKIPSVYNRRSTKNNTFEQDIQNQINPWETLQKQHSLTRKNKMDSPNKGNRNQEDIALKQQQFSFRSITDQNVLPQPSDLGHSNVFGGQKFGYQHSLIGGPKKGQNKKNPNLELEQRSSSQMVRDYHQIQKMESRSRNSLRQSSNNLVFGQNQMASIGPLQSRLMKEQRKPHQVNRDHSPKNMIDAGPKISLRTQKRDSAGGIPDDESILCATPPEQMEAQQQQQCFYYQPIQLTVNLQNMQPQPPYHTGSDIEQHNRMMMQQLHQQLKIENRQSSRQQYRHQQSEGTGQFNMENNGSQFDEESIQPTNLRNKKQQSSVRSVKKRDQKLIDKKKSQSKVHFQDSQTKSSPLLGAESPSSSSRRRTRGLGKKTIEKKTKMMQDSSLTVIRQKTSSVAKLTCTCKRSQCLKMYCECFTQGRFCDESCKCINCLNLPENKDKIRDARKSIRTRNPQAFKQKIENQSQGPTPVKKQDDATKQANIDAWLVTGCKCKKSGCQKKYCECFQQGVLCRPDKCQCCDCKNTKEEVQRRMANDDFLNEFADFIH